MENHLEHAHQLQISMEEAIKRTKGKKLVPGSEKKEKKKKA
jgi:hypothetical protein